VVLLLRRSKHRSVAGPKSKCGDDILNWDCYQYEFAGVGQIGDKDSIMTI
jgi:hypothetical protein